MNAPQLYGDRVAAYAVSVVVAALWIALGTLAWGACAAEPSVTSAPAVNRTSQAAPVVAPPLLILPSEVAAVEGGIDDDDAQAPVAGAGEQGAGSSAPLLARRPARVGSEPDAAATAMTRAVVATPVAELARTLTHDELRSVLVTAGWPAEWIEDGVRLACGGPGVIDRHSGRPAPTGESGCRTGEIGKAGEIGLYQLLPGWADHCGIEAEHLWRPLVNAHCAMQVNQQAIAEGRGMWGYWSVQP